MKELNFNNLDFIVNNYKSRTLKKKVKYNKTLRLKPKNHVDITIKDQTPKLLSKLSDDIKKI